MATPTPPITHLPGSRLRLAIAISHQYDNQKNVQVCVRVFDGPSFKSYVILAPGAKLTCNGADIRPTTTIYALGWKACPRLAAGGSYKITLTDEQGVSTSVVVVPVPRGALAIVTPKAGSTVMIPPGRPSGVLRVSYTYSSVALNSTVLVDSIVAICGVAPSTCGVVNSRYQYQPFATPEPSIQEDAATPTPYPVTPPPTLPDGQEYATPGPDGGPALGSCTGAIVKNKPLGPCSGVYDSAGDSSAFLAGPGRVSVSAQIQTPSIQSGFAAASCAFTGINATAPITWTTA